MNGLQQVVDEWIDKKNAEIRATGKIVKEIDKTVREVCWDQTVVKKILRSRR